MAVPIYEAAVAEVQEQFELARSYATDARGKAEALLSSLATISSSIQQITTQVTLEGADYSVTPFTETRPTKPDTAMQTGSSPDKPSFSLDLTAPQTEMDIGAPPEKKEVSLDLTPPDTAMNIGPPPVAKTFNLDVAAPSTGMNIGSPPDKKDINFDLTAPETAFNVGSPPGKGSFQNIDPGSPPSISGLVVRAGPIDPAAVTYESPLLTALKARLLADVQTDIDRPSIETLKWNRARARDLLTHQDMYAQKRAEWSKSSLPLPDGVLVAAIEVEDIRYANAYDDRSGQIAIEEANLAIKVRQDAVVQATQLEGILMNFLQTVQQRIFEASKATVEAEIQVCNAEIGKYRIMADIYQAVSNVKIAEAKNAVDIYATEVSAYRVEVEAETARVDAPIKAYQAISNVKIAEARAKVDTYATEVGAYKAGIDAEIAKVDAPIKVYQAVSNVKIAAARAIVDTYATEVQAYKAGIDAEAAKVDAPIKAYQAVSNVKIAGAKNLVDTYATEVNAYKTRVDAEAAKVDAPIKVYQAVSAVKIAQVKALVDTYVAEVTAFRVGVEAESARVDALVKAFNGEVEGYRADVSAYQALSTVETEILRTQANLAVARAGLYQKNGEIQIAEYEALTGLKIEAIKSMGAIVAQEVAGALSGIHAQASMSRQDSESVNESISSSSE